MAHFGISDNIFGFAVTMDIGEAATFNLSEKTLSGRTSNCSPLDDGIQQKNSEHTDISMEHGKHTESKENFGWSEICRLCANKSNLVVPIFDGEGAEHDLSSKIQKYLPIQV